MEQHEESDDGATRSRPASRGKRTAGGGGHGGERRLRADTLPRRLAGRWRFLADASTVLDASLDYQETLANVVRLAVPEIADYCIVALLTDDGSLRWAHASHRDPARVPLVRALEGYLPRSSGDVSPVAIAVRTGAPHLVSVVDDAFLRALAVDDTHLAALQALAPRSYLAVPLVARDRTFGGLLFATAESGRHYCDSDQELAQEVGRRSALAIDHAMLYAEASRAVKARDELTAVVSHDLKNPLSTIQLAVGFLLDDLVPDDEPHALERRQLVSVRRAAERMYGLIHDLLDLASADAGRLFVTAVPTSAAALVADAVELQRALAAARPVSLGTLVAEELPPVCADPARVAQLFANLIGNALKFTPPGGTITVGADPEPTGAGSSRPVVRFFVRDTGPGIPAEQQAHVFDRFWQARETRRLGTGLGLAIVKGIAEAHGGRAGVESTVGEGSTFWFTLPTSAG